MVSAAINKPQISSASTTIVTIKDVRSAVHQNDRKRAFALLKQLLNDDPTPEAWTLAARMIPDHDKKLKYLNRALFMDASYQPARDMLRKMGVKPKSTSRVFGEELLDAIYRQCDRSPILRRLPSWLQITLVSLVALIFMLTLLTSIGRFFQYASPAVTTEAVPEPIQVSIVSIDEIAPYMQATSLNVSGFAQIELPRVSPYQAVVFNIADSNGTLRSVEVRVYRTVSHMIEDRQSLDEARAWANMVASVNAVMLYPQGLDEVTVSQLTRAFKGIRG